MSFVPVNKYIIVDPIKDSDKLGNGIIIAPGNIADRQYKIGRVCKVSEDIEEVKIFAGDLILYDNVGAVHHRFCDEVFTTVKYINVIAVMRDEVVEK